MTFVKGQSGHLAQELGGMTSATRFLAEVAASTGRPLAVNLPGLSGPN